MDRKNSNIPNASGRAFPISFPAQSAGSATGVQNHSSSTAWLGNPQGLQHGIHGNYNISNMPSSFVARNSAVIGGPSSGGIQQGAGTGTASTGQYEINNLPINFSQLSFAGSYGHGSASHIANPMTNSINESNIPRNFNSGGGSNSAVAGNQLNLTASQVIQMLTNAAAGVPLSHNYPYQGEGGPFSSLSLNDIKDLQNAAFDINEYPQHGGHLASSSGSQGLIGFLQNQDFTIQNEEFPALTGFRGGNTEFHLNMHQKEKHLHDGMSSMVQSQHLPLARSTNVGFGGASSSYYPQQQQQQQQQQHAPSLNSTGMPYVPTNYQDFHSHEHDARNMLLPTARSTAANLPNAFPGMGMYEQYQHFQKQPQAYLRDKDVKLMQSAQNFNDKYGMMGLLNIVKSSNPAKVSLALGTDLTALGLDLTSPDPIHKKFASPWSDEPVKEEPEFAIPDCYSTYLPPSLKPSYFSRFRLETLFYIFYSMPKDEAQLYAANELHKRGWFYHKGHSAWFTSIENSQPLVRTNTYEKGSYYCFDPNSWEAVRKDNIVMQYEMIEKRPILPQH